MRFAHLGLAALLLGAIGAAGAEPAKPAAAAPAAKTLKVTGNLVTHLFRSADLKASDGKVYRLKGEQAKTLEKAAGAKDHPVEVEGTVSGTEKSPVLTVTAFKVLAGATPAKAPAAGANGK